MRTDPGTAGHRRRSLVRRVPALLAVLALCAVATGCAATGTAGPGVTGPAASSPPLAVPGTPSTTGPAGATASPGPTAEPDAEPAPTAAPTAATVVAPVVPAAPTVPPAPPADAAATLPAPVRVAVPVLGLDEPLIELGVDDSGAAEVPKDYDVAGWFAPGGRPGAVGPTVLLGHVDSTTGPAVFARLSELSAGDEIAVGLADGGSASYRVTAVDRFAKDDFPTFTVFGATLDDVLRLVTCGGDFDRAAGSYRENVVVTAVRT